MAEMNKQEQLKELIAKSLNRQRIRTIQVDVRKQNDEDDDDNRRSFSVSSNEPDLRFIMTEEFFGPANEILSHSKKAVNLERFDNGANILLDHDPSKVVGVIEGAKTIKAERLDVDMRFSRNHRGQEVKIDVDDGIRQNVSIGYTVESYKALPDVKNDNGFPTFEATSWTPAEASFVGVPADATVGPGREPDMKAILRRDLGLQNMDNEKFEQIYDAVLELNEKDKTMLNQDDDIVIDIEQLETKVVADGTVETKQQENPEMTDSVDKKETVKVTADYNAETAQAELQRVRDINRLGEHNHVSPETVDQWITEGRSADSVGRLILERDGADTEVVGAGDVQLTEKETRNYSILNVVRQVVLGTRSGIEFDVSDEIAKKLGKDTPGFFMPMGMQASSFGMQSRQVSTTPASLGGALVFDEAGSLIELLRPRMRVVQLGARTISGLTAPLTLPRMTGSAGFSWIAEGDSSGKTATEPGFDTVALVPNQALMRTGITKQQLATANFDVEQIVQEDFLDSLAVGLDEAAISGTAGNDEVPQGVLSDSNVTGQSVLGVLHTVNFSAFVDMETSASANDAPDGRAGYLTTPQVIGLAKQTEKASTTAQFIHMDGQINGFPAVGSTNVTSTISGSLGADGHAAIFSPDWSQLIIADWGAIEILVDPFTLKHRGIVELNGTLLADVAIRHPEIFTVNAFTA